MTDAAALEIARRAQRDYERGRADAAAARAAALREAAAAGLTYRQIAAATGLSHQRVAQIVAGE